MTVETETVRGYRNDRQGGRDRQGFRGDRDGDRRFDQRRQGGRDNRHRNDQRDLRRLDLPSNATTPISPDARSATGAKPHGPAAVSATTEGNTHRGPRTTTGVSKRPWWSGQQPRLPKRPGRSGWPNGRPQRFNDNDWTCPQMQQLELFFQGCMQSVSSPTTRRWWPTEPLRGRPRRLATQQTRVPRWSPARSVARWPSTRSAARWPRTISAVGDRRNVVALPMVHFEGPRANGSGHAHNRPPRDFRDSPRSFERKED